MHLITYRSKHTGFTLIELMITITVLAIILMIGSSLTRSWIDQSQVNNAVSALQEAVTQTKAIAIRNTHNTTLQEASASLCIYGSTIQIIHGSCPSIESNTALQTFSLSEGVSIKENANELRCMDFNYIGVIVPGSTCLTTAPPTLIVGKNNESAEITIR
ncbi:pilus assembly FimT family protein [Acinetobacter schindleri]|uniref:pilus assembly FimT family protein n=1 Tax=Acinetobacter schindleri TaxID=108981 RepID=UPI003F568568